jgi:hypothetical protein
MGHCVSGPDQVSQSGAPIGALQGQKGLTGGEIGEVDPMNVLRGYVLGGDGGDFLPFNRAISFDYRCDMRWFHLWRGGGDRGGLVQRGRCGLGGDRGGGWPGDRLQNTAA